MTSDSRTHATLLDRLRDPADPLAWDEFFGRYGRLVFGFARRRGCSDDTAEEIVQEVMLAVYQQREVFCYDPARGRFRDWLGAVARNQLARHRRGPAQRIRPGATPPEPADERPGVEDAWESAFEEALLVVLLDVVRREVQPRTYQAFELVTLGGFSGKEAARVTGLSRNAVYQARRAVLGRLAELAGDYGGSGRLTERLKRALEHLPPARVERSLGASAWSAAGFASALRSAHEQSPQPTLALDGDLES